MQTFMPYSDFTQSLQVLDKQRLGKQRVEGLQILNTLAGFSDGWRAHPAVRMWRGAIPALIEYTLCSCDLWTALGYKDSIADKIYDKFHPYFRFPIIIPKWCSNPRVIDSHKAMLYHKNPEHYKQFASYANITEYYWPV